jgi:hypothetical protein
MTLKEASKEATPMSDRYDPRERWRWEEEREREDQGPESEGRFARHGGDPRWGTGGVRAERPSSAPPPYPVPPTPDADADPDGDADASAGADTGASAVPDAGADRT